MPLYEYDCREHGVFELARSMQDSAKGAPCPWCQRDASRILSVPAVRQLDRSTRVALDRNERSRHEPRLSQRGAAAPTEPPSTPKFKTGGGRPWALEHG